MKLRLTGTRDECAVLARELPSRLGDLAEVVEVSDFYTNNRGSSVLGRVYVELRLAGVSGGRS
jgi:hypothetical protein